MMESLDEIMVDLHMDLKLHNYLEKLQVRQGVVEEDSRGEMNGAQQCCVLSCAYRQNHNSEKSARCAEEQEQGSNAANSDNYGHGGGSGGEFGDDGGGHDFDSGGLSEVDYRVEELDLGNEHCLRCSVNAEDKRTG